MRFSTASLFSAVVAVAAAYTIPGTQPDYTKATEGHAIYTPGLQQQVPKCAPFDITWSKDTGDKVTLVLLRGPSTNVVPIATIADSIDNTGSYSWTPSTGLEVDTTHYGILLSVEGSGVYQYSTQFGISAGECASSSTSTTAVETTTAAAETTTAAPASTPATIVTVIDDVTTTYGPEEASSTASVSAATTTVAAETTTAAASYSTVWSTFESTTTICPETESTAAPTTTNVVVPPVSTRVPIRPSTMRSSAAPSGVAATGTASVSPSSTPVFNGAGRNAVSFGAVAAAAFAVFAL
jgi:hypothetical protein